MKTIEDLCAFLHLEPEQTCKAVVYQKIEDDGYVVVFIRGDLEVNETKLRNLLKSGDSPGRADHAGKRTRTWLHRCGGPER